MRYAIPLPRKGESTRGAQLSRIIALENIQNIKTHEVPKKLFFNFL